MVNQKKCLVILFEAVKDGVVENSPSAVWLKNTHPDIDFTFVMRGEIENSSNLGFYKPELKSLLFIIKYISTVKFRDYVKKIDSELKDIVINHDLVWIRGPGFIPLIHGLKLAKHLKRNKLPIKLYLHLCANRMTFKLVKMRPSLKSFLKYFLGLLSKRIVGLIIPFTSEVFYTGSHVKRNFELPKDARFLIDTNVKNNPAINQTKKIVFLGRTDKLLPFVDQLYELKNNGFIIDAYGPECKYLPDDCVNKLGFIDPKTVRYTLKKYKLCFSPSIEHYEGFPRVILEAITAGCKVVVNKDVVFKKDIENIPEVIIANRSLLQTINSICYDIRKPKQSEYFLELLKCTEKVI